MSFSSLPHPQATWHAPSSFVHILACLVAVNECLTNNGGCDQLCCDTYDTFYCSCREGFRLVRDLFVCPCESNKAADTTSSFGFSKPEVPALFHIFMSMSRCGCSQPVGEQPVLSTRAQ